MNLLKILFEDGFYNAPALQKIDKRNNERLKRKADDIELVSGSYVNPEVLKVLAVRYFLDCYNTVETIKVLDYFDFINPATRRTDSKTWSRHETKKGEGNE